MIVRRLAFLMFAAAGAAAAEPPSASESGAAPPAGNGSAVEFVPSQVIGSSGGGQISEGEQVDLMSIYVDIRAEEGRNPDVAPPPVSLTSTTPFPENVFRLPNTVSSDWREALRQDRQGLLQGERGRALSSPAKATYIDGVLHYQFADGKKYLIFVTPNRVASIHLQEGEVLTQPPVLTNGQLFEMEELNFGPEEQPEKQRLVLVVSARFAESDGALVVATNRRIYHFILHATPSFATEVVRFLWEREPANPLGGEVSPAPATAGEKTPAPAPAEQNEVKRGEDLSFIRRIIPDELAFEFSFENPCDGEDYSCTEREAGQIKKLEPSYIYTDGSFTYFGWKSEKSPARTPALFRREPGTGQLVPAPYIVKRSLYIYKGVFDEAVLMLNDKIFLIIRNDNPA